MITLVNMHNKCGNNYKKRQENGDNIQQLSWQHAKENSPSGHTFQTKAMIESKISRPTWTLKCAHACIWRVLFFSFNMYMKSRMHT